MAARPALAGEPTSPAPPDAQLIEEVPNFGSTFLEQWRSADLPADFVTYEDEVSAYGRLRDTRPPQDLTLEDAVRLALMNNTDLQIQRLGPLTARTEVRRAQSIFDPSLFGDVAYGRSNLLSGSFLQPTGEVDPALLGTLALLGPPEVTTYSLTANGGVRKTLVTGGQLTLAWENTRLETNQSFTRLRPQYTTEFSLSLNQPLLRDFGWRYTTLLVRVAKTTETQTAYQYEAVVANIVRQVEEAYWRLVEAIENIGVQEQGLATAKELERQNEGKFKVGALPQTAVLEAQAEVARREALLIQARTAQVIARDTLRAILNFQREDSDALLMVRPADKPRVPAYEVNLERSLDTALDNRPELAAARLDVHAKGMLLKVAQNQLLPRLNAVASVGTNGLSGGPVVTETTTEDGQTVALVNPFAGGYGDALDRNLDGRYYNYTAGVTIEIPLANAQAKADYARSRIDVETAKRGLDRQQEQVTLEVKRAVTSLESDLKSIEATRLARELAEENVRNQQARYDVGLATTKDLLDFADRLTEAQAAEVRALTTYNIDLAELRRAEGTLLSARDIVVEKGGEESTPWWARF